MRTFNLILILVLAFSVAFLLFELITIRDLEAASSAHSGRSGLRGSKVRSSPGEEYKNATDSVSLQESSDVVCGAHRAANCAACPQGHGEAWCNGECVWDEQNDECVSKSVGFAGLPQWVASSFHKPPDVRPLACKHQQFPSAQTMPHVSMIIPYLHEEWNQIKGTVGSIITMTNMEILDTILFIDDHNDENYKFKVELEGLHPKVRVHSNDKREGLTRSKIIGAGMTTSPIIMFMEPHCVVNKHWLEPLVSHMMRSSKSTVVMPVIDVIPESSFDVYNAAQVFVGGFDWSLTFNWMQTPKQRNSSWEPADPFPTPATSGGIFAIWRSQWEAGGTYDDEMREWGGEHIEMSLRTWRCGGRIEIIPCSHIGHVFRQRNPYPVHLPQVRRNLKRAALVWLDEYLEKYYTANPGMRDFDVGDVSGRLALKKKLNCKSMDWYVTNIYPELMGEQRKPEWKKH